jgi:hypothetical protein
LAPFVLLGIVGKRREKRAGTGGAKFNRWKNQTNQKAAMNRNTIIRALLAAGWLFVAQVQADSVVSILADEHGLQSVPSDQWNRFGTYWYVLQGRCLVPYPGPPNNPNLRSYSLGDAVSFLVDDDTPPASGVNYARLEADLNWLLGAIAQARETKMNAERNAMLGLTGVMDSQEEGGASGFDSP